MGDRDRTGADPDKGDSYVFGFKDVTADASGNGIANDDVMTVGMLGANTSAPTIELREGQEFYLSLTNVGMIQRPDLFDPHTVHYHGFPNAASIFDGEPMASGGINMGSTFTYYYNNVEPGTYMYHCHVEASEHMQMGMLGNLFVRPAQDGTLNNGFTKFAYNDGDGSTGYDVAYIIQETAFDPRFHHADNSYNPLNFADMDDTYLLFNGRGYPDTIDPNPIANIYGHNSQNTSSLITATQGQRILLRISSLSTVDFYTVTLLGMTMQVVGQGARLLRGPDGTNLYYTTNSLTLGGGEANDVIIDTTNVNPGTYFLYTTNLNHLSNDAEDFGGMMTEIVIN
jgi:FtsP/CotA-like multicopper oxidase with cupredoxin domain